MFQSRNRGSFDFKSTLGAESTSAGFRFNLVIEVLLISSIMPELIRNFTNLFQSRNRGSFDFKKDLA